MSNLMVSALLLAFFVTIESASDTKIIIPTARSSNILNLRTNDVKDSHQERVHIKDQIGFDGKVHSIYFHPGKNEKTNGAAVQLPANTASIWNAAKSSETNKRSLDQFLSRNKLTDLQAEESKVFRPLFVYRQQVAKRLKLREGKSESDRPRIQRAKLQNFGYYYPHSYPPYYDQPRYSGYY